MTKPIPSVKPFLLILIFWIALTLVRAHAVDWVTTDGKTYKNVIVVKVEDDAVTILYQDGGALVQLVKLPPDLQKKFHYDPAKAKIAADARAQKDADNAAALEKEKEQADQLKHQQMVNDANAQNKAQASLEQPAATTTTSSSGAATH